MAVTYGRIKETETEWSVYCEPHVSIRMKTVFRFLKGIPPFKISKTQENAKDLLWFTNRYPMVFEGSSLKVLKEYEAQYDNLIEKVADITRPEYVPSPLTLKKPARNYQLQAVDLIYANKRALIGDDVGLGKTLVGIASIVKTKALPAAVVCQTHLPLQWKEKIEEFSDLTVHIIKKTKPYDLPKADVYIFGYSKLSGWEDYFDGFFKLVCFDECQELRRHDSSKYRAAKTLSESAEYSIGLSATPIYNYGDEIFNILNLLNPGCLGSYQEFSLAWGSWNGLKLIIKDPKALGLSLRDRGLLLRRTREDVGKELEQVNKIIHHVNYDEEMAKKGEKDLKEIAARVLTGSFVERGQAARMLDAKARYITGRAKAYGVAEYVKMLIESGKKVLLCGWHRDVFDIWLEELKEHKPVLYTGTESPVQKEASKKAFMEDSQVLIMSLRSGVGLDGLQEVCDTIVFGEMDWSPGVHHQCIGRLNRDGQKSQVMAVYLNSSSGTDPLMVDMLGLKSSQSEAIINPNLDVTEITSDDERIKTLAKRLIDA